MVTYVLLDDDGLKFTIGRLDQLVVGERLTAQEDVEHEGDTLEAQQVISRYLSVCVFWIIRVIAGAYRLAGISILSCGGSCLPFTIGLSELVV